MLSWKTFLWSAFVSLVFCVLVLGAVHVRMEKLEKQLKDQIATKANAQNVTDGFTNVRQEITDSKQELRKEFQTKIQNEMLERDRVDQELGRRIDSLETKATAAALVLTDVRAAVELFVSGYRTFNEANDLMREADDYLRQLVVSLEEVRKHALSAPASEVQPGDMSVITLLPSDDQILRTVELEAKLRQAIAALDELQKQLGEAQATQRVNLERIEALEVELRGK